MDIVKNLDELIKQVQAYNAIRLNKPIIVDIVMHPLTWDKIEPEDLVAIKNLRIRLNENVPLDLIEVGPLVQTEKNVECHKINTLEDIVKIADDKDTIVMSKTTLNTLKSGTAIIFYSKNKIRIRSYSPEKLVQIFEPGKYLDLYPIDKSSRGTLGTTYEGEY